MEVHTVKDALKNMEYFDEETGRKKRCEATGKTMFAKRDAQSKRNFLLRIGKEKFLRIYLCELCNSHHLTSQEER